MKEDIVTKSDIEKIIFHFYEKVKEDPEIGFFFSDVVKVNWTRHLPAMSSFWENVLFFTGTYEGDPLTTHRGVHKAHQTNPLHFQQWLKLFVQTVNELYEGEKAERMKEHARRIAALMLKNIDNH